MRSRTRSLALGLLVAILLGACATPPPPHDILSPENALVFGYVESKENPIDTVEFHKYGEVYIPPFKTPPRVLVFRNGNFMAENIKPGKYYIAAFHSKLNKFSLVGTKQAAYQIVVDVKPGSLTYLGSHRIYPRSGNAEPDIKPILNPGEREILRDLYHVTAGTGWQAKISRRLQDLRQ